MNEHELLEITFRQGIHETDVTVKGSSTVKTMRGAFIPCQRGFAQHPYTGVVIESENIVSLKKWVLPE